MSSSLCKTSVARVYQEVMDDVISGVREIFLEEGVDEQVLMELKHTWETKLKASKALYNEQEEKVKKQELANAAAAAAATTNTTNGFPKPTQPPVQQQPQSQHVMPTPQPQQQQQQQPQLVPPVMQQQQQQPAPQQPQQIVHHVSQLVETKMVPIQITLPAQPGTDAQPRVLTIQVPQTALQGNQLQKVLTGQVITATMNLPAHIASSVLQQHVNAVFNNQHQQQQQQQAAAVAIANKNITQQDGAHHFDLSEHEHDEDSTNIYPDDVLLDKDGAASQQQIEIEFVFPRSKSAVERRKNTSKRKRKMAALATKHDKVVPGPSSSSKKQTNANNLETVESQSTSSVVIGSQLDGAAEIDVGSETVESVSLLGQQLPQQSASSSSGLVIGQLDGPTIDTSDDDEDGSDDDNDDDDIDDDKDEEDQEMEEEGGEEEPLNSEDDVTDDDPTDLFDTYNIVVCQYDKIIRNRNKWKFYLKDGIMNLSGQDYVFQKANGDAEW